MIRYKDMYSSGTDFFKACTNIHIHVCLNKMYTNKYMVIKIHYCEKFITGQCNIYKRTTH